jgi:acyl-coenzyme A synthetase/AMP-(fatty) acid ligase
MIETTVLRLWAENVASYPDNTAICTRHHTVTYRELAQRAASYRIEFSSIPGTSPIFIVCADHIEIVAAMLAAMAVCRPFVPVSVLTPPPRLAAMLDELPPQAIVVDEAGGTTLRRAADGNLPLISGWHVVRTQDMACASVNRFDLARWQSAAGDDHGYVYFTSGTSGRPKGIRGSLEAIAHFIDWEIAEFGIEAGMRVSSLASPGFDAFLRDSLVPLCSGGTMCVAPRSAHAGRGLARWLGANEIQILHCVPTVFRTLRALGLTAESLPELRMVMLGGEAVRPSDVRWWRGLFGDRNELVNLYGSSETTMGKLFHRITADDETTERVPAGIPLPGVTVRVLDAEQAGDTGEIEISVPFRLFGYLNGHVGGFDASDPHRYRTGDLGRFREDGALEVLGRQDGQVKLRGLRIELDEVANVVLSHPGVHDVHVTVEGADTEESVASLRAYVVSAGDWDERELREFVRARLPHGTVPDQFIRVSVLPRTLNGKIDHNRLRATVPSGPRTGR